MRALICMVILFVVGCSGENFTTDDRGSLGGAGGAAELGSGGPETPDPVGGGTGGATGGATTGGTGGGSSATTTSCDKPVGLTGLPERAAFDAALDYNSSDPTAQLACRSGSCSASISLVWDAARTEPAKDNKLTGQIDTSGLYWRIWLNSGSVALLGDWTMNNWEICKDYTFPDPTPDPYTSVGPMSLNVRLDPTTLEVISVEGAMGSDQNYVAFPEMCSLGSGLSYADAPGYAIVRAIKENVKGKCS